MTEYTRVCAWPGVCEWGWVGVVVGLLFESMCVCVHVQSGTKMDAPIVSI